MEAALFNLRKLTAVSTRVATDLVHNSFAQDFYDRDETDESVLAVRKERRVFATQILAKMTVDTSATLRQLVQPLFLFTEVQKAGNDVYRLSEVTKQFIASEVIGQDIYEDRAGRYGLMILDVISKLPELTSLAEQLSNELAVKLKAGQVVVSDSTSRADLDKRAWYRFLNAYLHFKKSERMTGEGKERFLKTAFEYSPDLVDKNHKPGYFYDMHALLRKDKDGFKEDYLNYIKSNSDKQTAMTTLLDMSLVDPSFKKNLKLVYKEVMPGGNFDTYWRNAIDAGALKAPPILVDILGEASFSSKSRLGEWILLDFWGTWCGPCREEHPALQNFYESTVAVKSQNLSLLTVACRDTEQKVRAYMTKNKYSFPVAMSDNKIEKLFKVQGYPTKVLITPTGRYVTVPFGVDWVGFVKNYVEIE